MTDHPRIVIEPNIRFGKPTIRGTRIAVEDVLRMTAAGLSIDDILQEYTHLTVDDVRAAHEYAADYIHQAFVHAAE